MSDIDVLRLAGSIESSWRYAVLWRARWRIFVPNKYETLWVRNGGAGAL